MGEWVIREACLALKRWDEQGISLDGFVMHINLSGKQLLQKDLPRRLADMLVEIGVSPEWIGLKLTESSIMESETVELDILTELRQIGVSNRH